MKKKLFNIYTNIVGTIPLNACIYVCLHFVCDGHRNLVLFILVYCIGETFYSIFLAFTQKRTTIKKKHIVNGKDCGDHERIVLSELPPYVYEFIPIPPLWVKRMALSVFYVHIYRHASTLFLGTNSGIFVKGEVQQGKQKEY